MRSIRTFILCAIVLLFQFHRSSFAQVKPYSLPDYLKIALVRNPLVNSAQQSRASAEYAGKAVNEGYYPQIGISSHFLFAPGYDEAITNGGEIGAQITGSYIIYDGGARSLEIEKSGVNIHQGDLNAARTKGDIVYSVSVAFVEANKEERELAVVEQDYALLSDYLGLVKQLHASGQAGESDLLKTTVDLNDASMEVQSRNASLRNSLLDLAQAAGISDEEETDVDTSVVSLAFDTTFAPDQNIELRSNDLQLRQAELDAQLATSQLGPSISMVADAGALTSLPNLKQGFANVFGASFGISFSLPVITFGSTEDRRLAAEAAAKSISLQNEYSKSSIVHDFETT